MKRALSFICACAILALTACQPKEVAVTSVTVSPSTLELTEGDAAVSLTAKVLPENAIATVSWTSSDNSVASVSNNGSVTPLKEGSATITATADGKSGSCKVTVGKKVIPVESVTLDKTELTLTEGDETTLIATIAPENATNKNISWKSSDAAIASVDNAGKISAVKPGEATITVTTEDGSKTASCKVTVAKKVIPVESVTLDKSELTLYIGDEAVTLVATVNPSDATDKSVTWSSSDASVASVNQAGAVAPLKVGSTTITATAGDKSASCKVTVSNVEASSLTLSATKKEMLVGDVFKIIATVLPDNVTVKEVAWSSSNVAVASVSVDTDGTTGVVTALSEGSATITATIGSLSKECTIEVKDPAVGVEMPDLAFRTYMLDNFDKNKDGILTADEAKIVTTISLSSNNDITSLKGIEYCTELSTLYLSYCKNISEIDLTSNTKLKYLYGTYLSSNTDLKTIDLSALVNLQAINLTYTRFESIDFSHCTNLTSVEIGGDNFTSIDVSMLPNLNYCDVYCRNVESIDLTHNTNIVNLYLILGCESLTIPTLPKLKYFSYQISKSTKTLSLGDNTTLEKLTLYYAYALESIDISKCSKLATVKIEGNEKMTEIDLSTAAQEMNSLTVTGSSVPFTVWLKTNQTIKTQNLGSNVTLKYKE